MRNPREARACRAECQHEPANNANRSNKPVAGFFLRARLEAERANKLTCVPSVHLLPGSVRSQSRAIAVAAPMEQVPFTRSTLRQPTAHRWRDGPHGG